MSKRSKSNLEDKNDPLTPQDYIDAKYFIEDNPFCDLAKFSGVELALKFRKRRREWASHGRIHGISLPPLGQSKE